MRFPFDKLPLVCLIGVILVSTGAGGPDGSPNPDGASSNGDAERVTFMFSRDSTKKLYYVIEQEFREYGGVPPLLSYTTTIKDRRAIHQRIMPQSTRQMKDESVVDTKVTVLWECDRYEVTEQGMRDTLSFDSVRHTHPPTTLWELGGINGSKSSYFFDPATGEAQVLNVTPGKCAGESNRRPLTKIGARCQLTKENLAEMVDVMGAYWMPGKPVAVGETWSRTTSENMKTFGTVETTIRCTLDDISRRNGRRIATVQIEGSANLIPQTQPAANNARPGRGGRAGAAATTQATHGSSTTQPTSGPAAPAAGAPPKKPEREFQIDKFACKGTVEFDLDRGELASMNLQRELAFVAKVESEKSGPMELHSGSSQTIKIKSGHTPPPKPIIVGGPKPPDVPEEPEPRRPTPPTRRTVPGRATTLPADIRTPQPPATTQPSP